MICNQLQSDPFFSHAGRSPSMTEISKIAWRADLASAAFGKSTIVYGQIDENGHAVRKRPARKMPITDKMGKNGRLSVKLQLF